MSPFNIKTQMEQLHASAKKVSLFFCLTAVAAGAQTSTMQHQSQPYSTVSRQAHDPHREAVMEAARAAQRVKEACTIDEDELLALRPTLLKGYASMRNQERLVAVSGQQNMQ